MAVDDELERLRRAEKLLVDIQGVAHLGTWEWDPAQPTATWSDELYRIYGVTPAEYTPSYEGYLQKVHPDDRAHVMAATEAVFTRHEPYSHDERILRPDGSIRWLHTWAYAIVDDAGKLHRLIGVCQDITEIKTAQEQRERAEQVIARAKRLEAIGRVTGGIAHDFNNILGVVSGYATLLHRRAAEASTDREQLGEILAAVERAAQLTTQLLAFSNEEQAQIRRAPLALDRTIEDLAPLLARMVGEDIAVELEIERTPQPIVIVGNSTQIEQVVMNLVVNAREAMPGGGTLTIATRLAGDRAKLVVSDTGIGMTDEVQAQMFEPFFTTRPGHGTGMGLATVYGIVKQSGGTIDVTSAPGAGTRFEIAFPIAT